MRSSGADAKAILDAMSKSQAIISSGYMKPRSTPARAGRMQLGGRSIAGRADARLMAHPLSDERCSTLCPSRIRRGTIGGRSFYLPIRKG